jgi:hypothetical protein
VIIYTPSHDFFSSPVKYIPLLLFIYPPHPSSLSLLLIYPSPSFYISSTFIHSSLPHSPLPHSSLTHPSLTHNQTISSHPTIEQSHLAPRPYPRPAVMIASSSRHHPRASRPRFSLNAARPEPPNDNRPSTWVLAHSDPVPLDGKYCTVLYRDRPSDRRGQDGQVPSYASFSFPEDLNILHDYYTVLYCTVLYTSAAFIHAGQSRPRPVNTGLYHPEPLIRGFCPPPNNG